MAGFFMPNENHCCKRPPNVGAMRLVRGDELSLTLSLCLCGDLHTLSGKILHYVIPAKDRKVCMRGSTNIFHHINPSNLDSSQLSS